MKTYTILSLLIASVGSLSALTVNFSNVDSGNLGESWLPIADSSGNAVPFGLGTVSVGYFSNEAAVASGDFSSFVLFGASSTVNGASLDANGLYQDATAQTVGAGSSFIGETLFTFISYNNEYLVAKSSVLFFEETGPTDSIGMNINSDAGISYLFGGDTGPNVEVADGAGFVPSITLQAVPEPSAFALIAGCFGFAWVMVRRRA